VNSDKKTKDDPKGTTPKGAQKAHDVKPVNNKPGEEKKKTAEEEKKKADEKKQNEKKKEEEAKRKLEEKNRKEEEKKRREELLKDPDRDFFSFTERIGTLISDIIKLSVVIAISFLIAAIPWFVGLPDGNLPKYQFNVSGVENLCYWYGDTGLLDDKNPCKYRGYTSRNRHAKRCIPWKKAVDLYKKSQSKFGDQEKKMLKEITTSKFAVDFKVGGITKSFANRNDTIIQATA